MAVEAVKLEPFPGGKIRVRGPSQGSEAWPAFNEAARAGGARYDSVMRTLLLNGHNLSTFMSVVQRAGYALEVHPDVAATAATARAEASAAAAAAMERGDVVLAGGRALRDYQRIAAAWLSTNGWRAILADSPGVGKTPSVVVSWPRGARVVVVCPKVAIGTWTYHVGWRAPEFDARVVRTRGAFRWPEAPGDVKVCSFERLPKAEELAEGSLLWTSCPEGLIVVVDEAHLAKNIMGKTPSKRGLATQALCVCSRAHGGGSTIVTGTPLDNWPPDLLAMIRLAGLEERSWRTPESFYADFGGDPRGGTKQEWSRDGVKDHVPLILRNVMLRREKDEVLSELPEKQWEHITVEIPREVAAIADEAVAALAAVGIEVRADHPWGCSCLGCRLDLTEKTRKGAIPFELISRARSALATAKLPALQEIAEVMEPGGPFLVWACHTAPLEALVAARKGWALITGSTTERNRKRIEEAFQAGEYRGLALSQHEQIGVSITLTRAWRSVHLDMPFKPSTLVQCEDRIHRFGQTRAVMYTYMVADHPLDRWLTRLIGRKAGIEAASVGAASVAAPPESILPSAVPAGCVVAASDALRPPRANEAALVRWAERQTTGAVALLWRTFRRQNGMFTEPQWSALVRASGWSRSAS